MLPLTRAEIEARPSLRRDDLEWCGAGERGPFDRPSFYSPYLGLPFI
jgi:hypothetical protein